MAVHHIPVDWQNPLQTDFTAFERLMQALPVEKTLIHCAANFRVTAFYSLYALKHLGWSGDKADEFRSLIWQGRNNPVWDEFISRMKAKTTGKVDE